MNSKGKQIIIRNILLFALLFGLVTMNKKLIRPNFEHIPLINILAGCFPNFIAAFLISLAIINAVLIKNPGKGRVIAYAGSAFVFLVLTFEEFKPIWGASEYFDSFDILASGFGSLLSVLLFELINHSRKNKQK